MSGNSTMLKVFPIVLFLFAVACMTGDKKQEHSAFYDEAVLKDFVFATADPAKSVRVLDSVLADAAQDSLVFYKTVTFLEKSFGDPNSLRRNEELYIKILQAKIESPRYNSEAKAQTLNELNLRRQNQHGTIANDFVYTTAAGLKKRLYDLKADYTLVYFYNPECNACREMKTALINLETINSKVNMQDLKILAMYIERDEKIWLDHLNDMPKEWIHGRDENEYIYKNKVYDLRAIPTLYLLDKEKKVLLKDCSDIRLIEERLAIKTGIMN